MTYLQFHILFIVPPILFLALALKRPLSAVGRYAGLGLGLMPLVALVYTTPWDNYLIAKGVWFYGEDRVIGTVGHVPIEEYAFFLLQPVLTGLWLYNLLHREDTPLEEGRVLARWGGVFLYGAAGLAGVLLLGWDRGYYLGLILAWVGPVLAGQWAYGGHVLWRNRRIWLPGAAVPTIYLWLADRLALGSGIWGVSGELTTGLHLFGLPIEEAIFFAVTNLMVVQGLLLFLWVTERLLERRAPGEGAVEKKDRGVKHPDSPVRAGGSAQHRPESSPGRRM